jgi:hypothetical protein
MHKSGELKTKEELLSSQQSFLQYTGSLLKQLFVWAGRQVLSTSSPHEQDAALADKLIVTSLLQVRSQSTKTPHVDCSYNHMSSICFTTDCRYVTGNLSLESFQV